MAWPRVLVAGGSIGGLTTALLLSDLGCEVDVFERSAALLEGRGAGIVVLPITERYFAERGLPRPSLELAYWKYVDRSGEELSSDLDRFRFSGWNTLYRGLLSAFDTGRYHLGSEMVGFEQAGDHVTMRLADGSTTTGDLLVCADGAGSTGRAQLLPEVGHTYAGYVAWRGVTRESRLSASAQGLLSDAMVYQVLDPGHILAYAIPSADGAAGEGERAINFVWYRNYPEGEAWDEVMTDVDGFRRPYTVPPGAVPDHRLEALRDHASEVLAPVLAEVVTRADEVLVQAIFDLESPRLQFGRVALLGDAAFVVRPHLAAGQAKACADAWALRDALAEAGGDVRAALERWEPAQLNLGRATVDRSRRMGERSQFTGEMVPGDPHWKFGLPGHTP